MRLRARNSISRKPRADSGSDRLCRQETFAARVRPNAVNQNFRGLSDSRMKDVSLLVKREKSQINVNELADKFNKLQRQYNYLGQERDRLQKCCEFINNQLMVEKRKTLELQVRIQQIQLYKRDPIVQLQQKLRSLVLNSKIHKSASTQTDTNTEELQRSSNSQSVEEIIKKKATILLKQPDVLLSAFIAELEREKYNVQDNNKCVLMQLEKHMKDDMRLEIEFLKEEHQRQLDEIALFHTNKMKENDRAHNEDLKRLMGRIEYLQNDLTTTRTLNDLISHQLEESREREDENSWALGRAEQEIFELKKNIASLADYKKNYQDNVNTENLKKEIEKYKEINEIVIGEFTKVERERNELLLEFNKNLDRIEQVNIKKHHEIESRIREIKRKYCIEGHAS